MIDRIETPRLVLRKARENDLESIWRNVWSDSRLAEKMLWKPTKSHEEADSRLRKTLTYQKENYAYFVCLKSNDMPIGFAGIRQAGPDEYEESGICIAFDYQNKGYGTEVLDALLDLAFSNLNGHTFLYGCFHDNVQSAALCKTRGFIYSHSEKHIRDWDQYEYMCDYYKLEK